jgi:hypothetical protein
MKILISDFNGKYVSVSLQAENQAELYQLDEVRKRLEQTGVAWSDWDDMNGQSGIYIAAIKAHD